MVDTGFLRPMPLSALTLSLLLSDPCPQEGCPNATCFGELVFKPCAPCPLTCDDISGQAVCLPDRACSSPGEGHWTGPVEALLCMMPDTGFYLGCWCPEGQVLGTEGRCVKPSQCPCLVGGTRYWPGQRIKMDCQLCFCQDGRPHRCRPNPECAGKPLPEPFPGGPAPSPDHRTLTPVIFQWIVAGLRGPPGQSAWGPVAARASSGLFGAPATHASLAMVADAVAFTAKPAGTDQGHTWSIFYFCL